MTQPIEVRVDLLRALRLDLVGPAPSDPEANEILPQSPSRWYLNGFLVPVEAGESQRAEPSADDVLDQPGEKGGSDDAVPPESAAARMLYFPSSIGLSCLVPPSARALRCVVRWGDYRRERLEDGDPPLRWIRTPREEAVPLPLPAEIERPETIPVPNSGGLELVMLLRAVQPMRDVPTAAPLGTRALSVFLVNRRPPDRDEIRDQAFIFQAELELTCEDGFVPRENMRGFATGDWDERVADLQYRDVFEYAVGHGVASQSDIDAEGHCRSLRTCWIPCAEVERVAPQPMSGVELRMEELATLADAADAARRLGPLVSDYRSWIAQQRGVLATLLPPRRETADQLLLRAEGAAKRIEAGIAALADPQVLVAFRLANRAMAKSGRRRAAIQQGLDPALQADKMPAPAWRPFQLAFLLLNLEGIAKPTHPDRELVDLLFFPTGGGKTEAYLGLAAITLVLRRLRNPGIAGAGLSVLMRYTLRLLTLDQLGRAAALICALELERKGDEKTLGEWPFEIGLWVGMAATPNRMGAKGDPDPNCAYRKTIAYQNNSHKSAPIPLENCPWCDTKFKPNSFRLIPSDKPLDLRVQCLNLRCDFRQGKWLPILSVDQPIYRRLPCFIVATVDKFAALPWTGEVGAFFGRVDRHDADGFYGPGNPKITAKALPGALLPPDLIIQDELHLISGPMGTIAGLYEAAIDALCTRGVGDARVRPKIVASTATVRRAEQQIRALFDREAVDVFPPPGPDRRDSFFARTLSPAESPARWYVGVAAPGRSLKVVLLRAYLTLMAAAQKAFEADGATNNPANAADPYMTLLGYFNSLRELGGSRRIVEDEVSTRLTDYRSRRRVGESDGLFRNRRIAYDVVELTSRVSTAKVAEAKQRLALPFDEKSRVDVAIATNMISVGLDIVRLGLMVVLGQPKTSAEYIQATSRVGRDPAKPGLVVTLLNVHKPRDRSHYERFRAYHETFYRHVEATSVTPYSPRALDRALAGTVVGWARLGEAALTPARGAEEICTLRSNLDRIADALAERGARHARLSVADANRLRQRLRERVADLLDEWSNIAADYRKTGTNLKYQRGEPGEAKPLLHQFLDPELNALPPALWKFRANRSMRDVEPSVNLWVRTPDNHEIPEEAEEA